MSSPEASTSREPLQEMQNTMFAAEEAGGGAKARFNTLVVKAKQLARDGYVSKALDLNKKALKLFNNEKLIRRIKKMEAFLQDYNEESDGISEGEEADHSMVNVGNGFFLYKGLHDKLYDYQREGVLWMWGLYKKHKGGILGDDMGLGKTIQVIAFLSGMFDAEKIKCVMIVLPVAVMLNWDREFQKWAPGIHIEQYHGGSKADRARALRKVQHRGGVCLTSYGMLVNHATELAQKDGRNFVWDYIILDEGHKIKNPSNKCSKGVQAVSAKQRLILSGTPIMNNLKEMWALYDWAHQGTLLGRAKTFSMEYETPITKARQKDATAGEMRLGQEMANHLQKLITPYFLRRTKADMGDGPEVPTFTRKNDLVCWVFLSDIQQKIYEGFVNTPAVKELLNSSRSPLVALTVLKKICDHPRLLNNGQCVQLGLPVDKELMKGGSLSPELASECAAIRIDHIKTEDLVKESGKLVFLIGLIDRLKTEGHRCLIFSQSCKVLDIITKVLGVRGHNIIRLDGSIRQLPEREKIIEKFTNDTSINVFLLTTQVGGVGLTITAANRVIIYDPSWNPATDAQAVDRAFRIGQEKDVVVYRLITCGSVEEKIYRRQIFKNSITKQATGESKNPFRYFSNQELFELFVLDNPRMSVTQQQLQELHGGQETTDTSLDEHIAFLHTLEMFGISHHDVMFTKDAVPAPTDDGSAMGEQYINGRVAKAQQMLTSECRDNKELARQLGHYPGSEVASQSDKGGKGKRSAASRLMPPAAAEQQQWHHEDIAIVKLSYEDTSRNIPSRLPAPPTHAESFGDTNEVVDLTQMPSDNEDLETTMSRLDISVSVTNEDDKMAAEESPQQPCSQLSPRQQTTQQLSPQQQTAQQLLPQQQTAQQLSPQQQIAQQLSPGEEQEEFHDVEDISVASDEYHSLLQEAAPDKNENDEVVPPGGYAADTPSPTKTRPTPTLEVLSTPVLPSSGAKRRQLSAMNTPASVPRRRGRKSVCYSDTPRRLSSSPAVNVLVNTEQLVFSPRQEEPVMHARCPPSNLDITSTLDYDAFTQHLHSNLNSTEMPSLRGRDALAAPVVIEESPDVTPNHSRLRDCSMEYSVIADSEDDGDDCKQVASGQSEVSSCDSPIAVKKHPSKKLHQRRVVDNSSDEDEEGTHETNEEGTHETNEEGTHETNEAEVSGAKEAEHNKDHRHMNRDRSAGRDDQGSGEEDEDSQSDEENESSQSEEEVENSQSDETEDNEDSWSDDDSQVDEEDQNQDSGEEDVYSQGDEEDGDSEGDEKYVDPHCDKEDGDSQGDEDEVDSQGDGAEEQEMEQKMNENAQEDEVLSEEDNSEEVEQDADRQEDVEEEVTEEQSGHGQERGHNEARDQEEVVDESEEDEEELTAEDKENYLRFMIKSKELKAGGDLQGALRYALRGLQIYKGDEGAQKYAKRLCKKLEAKF